MKKYKRIFILCLILAIIITFSKSNTENVLASYTPGRVESMMKSTGLHTFTDSKSGETVIIDSADFYYLAQQIDQMNAVFGR